MLLVPTYMICCRPKKYTMKSAKRYYALLRDTLIYFYKSPDETNQNSIHHINLRGASCAVVK